MIIKKEAAAGHYFLNGFVPRKRKFGIVCFAAVEEGGEFGHEAVFFDILVELFYERFGKLLCDAGGLLFVSGLPAFDTAKYTVVL